MKRVLTVIVVIVMSGGLLAQVRPAELIKQVMPGVVLISGELGNGDQVFGTGFLVDSSGTIVTNFHVVRSLTKATVKLPNGDTFDRVTVRAIDQAKDLAILQVPGFGLPTLQLGNSDAVVQGDSVLLIGSPLGLQGTVSSGLVSAIRPIDGYRVFQTDAAANPGNSGGPMINEAGLVVGVLTFGIRDGQNLNFVASVIPDTPQPSQLDIDGSYQQAKVRRPRAQGLCPTTERCHVNELRGKQGWAIAETATVRAITQRRICAAAQTLIPTVRTSSPTPVDPRPADAVASGSEGRLHDRQMVSALYSTACEPTSGSIGGAWHCTTPWPPSWRHDRSCWTWHGRISNVGSA